MIRKITQIGIEQILTELSKIGATNIGYDNYRDKRGKRQMYGRYEKIFEKWRKTGDPEDFLPLDVCKLYFDYQCFEMFILELKMPCTPDLGLSFGWDVPCSPLPFRRIKIRDDSVLKKLEDSLLNLLGGNSQGYVEADFLLCKKYDPKKPLKEQLDDFVRIVTIYEDTIRQMNAECIRRSKRIIEDKFK